jgi:hypothetical protein
VCALQLVASTDVYNPLILLVFAHYIGAYMVKKAMFCHQFKERLTGSDIFNLIDAYFNESKIVWSHCISVCTNGVSSVTEL